MEARVAFNNDQIIIKITGRIDSTTVDELKESFRGIEFRDHVIVMDFTEVYYISSAGLRQLLIIKKNATKGFKLVGVSKEIYDILLTTGFAGFLDIELAKSHDSSFIDKSIKEILEGKFLEMPDKVFLRNETTSYTWNEVYKAVQVIAFDLYKLGVRKGTHVGICSTNSINWVLAFFAVQKLGGIACLLNFGYTKEEFYRVFKAGDITHFVYGDIPTIADDELDFLATLPENGIKRTYSIKSDINFKDRLDEYEFIEGLFADKVEHDDATVMIYTSGSTGLPKGVLLSAFNIINASEYMMRTERIGDDDRLCFITPLFHILGLCVGLFECAISNCEMFIPKDIRTKTILSAIEQYKCTAFRSVPTMVIAMINNAEFNPLKVRTLKTCVLAGAPTTEAQLERIQDAFPATTFFNAYGLSEMAPISMTGFNDPIESLASCCGKPIDNIRLLIQNTTTKEECAPGEDGEILVAGYNMMACYYKIDVDSQSIDSEGYLHTGDIGNIDEKGNLHITGRLKELIIRGGENITPSEVAEPISQYEGVHDVKVVGVPHAFFGEVACACIVMKDGYTFDEEKMRAFLATKLTKQKLPEYYYVFDKFPMLASGKVDGVTIKKLAEEKYKQ